MNMASLFGIFKPKPPQVTENPALGSLRLKDSEWQFQIRVGDQPVEASVPDEGGNPCAEALKVAQASAAVMQALWKAAVDYTVGEFTALKPRFKIEPSEFELEAVSFHAPGSFEGGEVVFWFRIASDKNGSYFVPLHHGEPLLWHRDS
jgi:hypothetical protein